MSKVAVQLLSYNGERFLQEAVAALSAQTFTDIDVYILDNASTDSSVEIIKSAIHKNPRSWIFVKSEENRGFAGGHNKLYAMHEAEYVLCLNQDAVLAPDYIEKLVNFADAHPRVGSVSGKLLRAPGTLDSAGLIIRPTGQVIDIGAGEPDKGDYDGDRQVFGVSGAAPMYRRSAIADVSDSAEGGSASGGGTLFDAAFFAYKEDVDLAWRLRLRGWESYVVGAATATHVRTMKDSSPYRVADTARQRLSAGNHLRMLVKNLAGRELALHGLTVLVYELAKFVYLGVRQPAALPGYADFFRGLPDALKKRKVIQSRKTHSISPWMGRA